MSDTTTTPADLLRQLDWMRALARELVSDPELAEDLAQDTLVIGLERPPRDGAGLRGWIATVMRNRFHEGLRARENRRARERANAREEEERDTEELAERMQLQREVSRLLLELDEPYRATLLMRFYGDLPPRAIAARQGVPVATVKSRLHRGLAQLRERLDRTHPDRKSWLAALAPWAREGKPLPSTGGALTAWALSGGVLMNTKLALAAALLIAAGAWIITRDDDATSAGTPQLASVSPTATGDLGPAPVALPDGAERDAARSAAPASATPATRSGALAIVRNRGSLSGVVLDVDDGRLIGRASLSLRATTGAVPPGMEFSDDRASSPVTARTDQDGAFAFEGLAEGPYEIEVSDRRGRSARSLVAVTSEGAYAQLWLGREAQTDSSRHIAVFVRDAQGHAAQGVRVNLRGRGRAPALSDGDGWTVTTDAHGWAEFPGAELERGVFIARGPGGGVARLDISGPRDLEQSLRGFDVSQAAGDPKSAASGTTRTRLGLELTLADAGAIEGRVRGAAATSVSAWARSWHRTTYAATTIPFEAACDEAGHFRLEALPPGPYDLTVNSPPGKRLALAPHVEPPSSSGATDPLARFRQYTPRRVEVEAGATSFATLELVEGPVLSGRVLRGEDGAPVAGARVFATLPQGLVSDPDRVQLRRVPLWRLDSSRAVAERDPTTSAMTITDDAGRYTFAGLLPGPFWRVEVTSPGLSFDRRSDVVLSDGETTELEHRLSGAGGIQGVCASSRTLGLRRAGAEAFEAIFTTPRRPFAPFTIPGLAAGTYEIHAVHSNDERPTTKLAEAQVRAGELTWVDLTEASPHHVEGRVLYRGGPVVGATLDFFGPQVVTDDEGRFRWHYPFVYSGKRGLNLVTSSITDATTLRIEVHDMCNGLERLTTDIHVPEGAIELSVLDGHDQPLEASVELSVLDGPGAMGLGSGLIFQGRFEAPEESKEEAYTTQILGAWSRQSRARRRCEPDGRVRFGTLPAGRYRLRVVSDGALHVAPVTVDLTEGEELDLVARPVPGGTLKLRVERGDGTPVIGEGLYLVFAGDEHPVLCETDGEGLLRVEHAPPGPARAIYPTHATGDDTQVEFEITAGEQREVTLRHVARGP